MKNRILILFFLLAVTGCGDKDLKEILYLTDGWQFSQNKEEGIWYKASVPGTIHTDLLNQGLIKDPLYGENDVDLDELETYYIWKYNTQRTTPVDCIQINWTKESRGEKAITSKIIG